MAVLEDDGTSAGKDASKAVKTSVVLVVNKNEFKVCKLSEIHEQQTLDLVLQAGAEVDFKVVGEKPATVYLTGYYLEDEDNDDGCSGEEEDTDGEMVDFIDDEAVEDDEITEESEASFTGEEDEEEIDSETGEPRIQEMSSDEEEEEEDSEEEEVSLSKPNKSNKRSAKLEKENIDSSKNKKSRTDEQKPVQKPAQPTPEVSKAASPDKKKSSEDVKKQTIQIDAPQQDKKEALPKDLKIEDIKIGDGAKAKKGRKIGITYKGMLSNGKVFDESKGNDILYFTVGKHEVVQGLELGVQDMTLGGVRRLTIPPALGYGAKSQAKIPGNSTMIFEVKLVKVETKKN